MTDSDAITIDDCPPCQVILHACDKLGDGEICRMFMDDVKTGKMSLEQFKKKVKKRFGARKIKKAMEESISELGLAA